jgi:hypothetical protein
MLPPKPPPIQCPLCRSFKVRLVVILPMLLIYICDRCFAEFTINKPESE